MIFISYIAVSLLYDLSNVQEKYQQQIYIIPRLEHDFIKIIVWVHKSHYITLRWLFSIENDIWVAVNNDIVGQEWGDFSIIVTSDRHALAFYGGSVVVLWRHTNAYCDVILTNCPQNGYK